MTMWKDALDALVTAPATENPSTALARNHFPANALTCGNTAAALRGVSARNVPALKSAASSPVRLRILFSAYALSVPGGNAPARSSAPTAAA